MRIIFTLLLLCLTMQLAAQGIIEGKTTEKDGKTPIEMVNVTVRQRGSSKVVKAGLTDSEGKFRINGLADGHYTVALNYLGYNEEKREVTVSQKARRAQLGTITMSENEQLLSEAVVTGQRSEMKLEVDRKSFNVEGQIAVTGGAATDVLENIPSVEVDNDGNVSLRGNTSVEVWINGKQSGLTSDNQGDILRQIPAESIERVEVIDNPSAKFSAEGSAGIINIILKKDVKPGYYGSIQAGGDTHGGANTSLNFNYTNKLLSAYLNVGYRHMAGKGGSISEQTYSYTNTYQRYATTNYHRGNNLFSRAGVTLNISKKDELGLNGMFMLGGHRGNNITPYQYGTIGADQDSYIMTRRSRDGGDMTMYNVALEYKHSFSDRHFINFSLSHNRWHNDGDNFYQDSTAYFLPPAPTEYVYQKRPVTMENKRWELKLDYENQFTEELKLQAGYQANIFKENSPQESWVDSTSWEGTAAQEDKFFFNRFIYKNQIHAFYTTLTYNHGKFGIMGGLRGEFWHVDTESYDWEQEHDSSLRDKPFKKDYFELFPSVFMSYQLTERDQFQLNYTRRLRRPWGGQLNSFKNTRDATMVSFGNPELTPEFSNSFSFNYLRTWEQHSLLLSAYYRPTTDVMQRINWQSLTDGVMYQTTKNLAKSTSTGLEITSKNKLSRILDITTNANFYYYKLDGFTYQIDGQTISGESNSNFSWNARLQASLILPYEISVQATGRYNSRQSLAQGYRRSNGNIDLGLRKTFANKTWSLSVNCRDLLNTRRFKSYTSSDSFTRNQKNWRNSRSFSATLTYSFGNTKPKRNKREGQDMEMDTSGGYGDSDM